MSPVLEMDGESTGSAYKIIVSNCSLITKYLHGKDSKLHESRPMRIVRSNSCNNIIGTEYDRYFKYDIVQTHK